MHKIIGALDAQCGSHSTNFLIDDIDWDNTKNVIEKHEGEKINPLMACMVYTC